MVSVSQLRLKGVSMVTKLISVGIQPDLRPTVWTLALAASSLLSANTAQIPFRYGTFTSL